METVWDQEKGLIPKKARRGSQASNQPPGYSWRKVGRLLWASECHSLVSQALPAVESRGPQLLCTCFLAMPRIPWLSLVPIRQVWF